MKLQIFGSGGGEGYPAAFCACEHCENARKAGGKSIRTLSQSCIDGKILIDLPADTALHSYYGDLRLSKIGCLLITHAHSDHFEPALFGVRGGSYAHNMRHEKLLVYGSGVVKNIFDKVADAFDMNGEIRSNIVFLEVREYEQIRYGKYKITPIPARHAPELKSLNYVIDDGRSVLLYLVDTGKPQPEIINYLRSIKTPISCVVMDGTMGKTVTDYPYHMTFSDNIALKNELLSEKIATDKTIFAVTHITHNHAGTHSEIEKFFEGSGITVAYDGVTLEF